MSTPKYKPKPKISKGIPETIENIDPMISLRSKLKMCDLEIQYYVAALQSDNKKLKKNIAQLQANNDSLSCDIEILREQQSKPKLNITFRSPNVS